MDFEKTNFDKKGHGAYDRLPAAQLHAALPLLWLAYCGEPSDSGAIHSDVKQRWRAGDPAEVEGMAAIAAVARDARRAIELGDAGECRRLMGKNFELRRALFGDAVLGATNLRLVAIASENGGVAKFPGSGGAVVGTCDPEKLAAIRSAYERESFVFVEIQPYFPPEQYEDIVATFDATTL